MKPVEVLALVSGQVDRELLLRNEYLAAENEILRSKLGRRVDLTRPERLRLAKLGNRLGRKALQGVGCIVKPETVLRWYRDLVATKFDGSKQRGQGQARRIAGEIEELVLRLSEENPRWGYERIAGALANIGHIVAPRTVGYILERNGVSPAPDRGRNVTWERFIETHKEVLAAMDFFTVEVLTQEGLYYVLFVIRLDSREICVAGMTPHPNDRWTEWDVVAAVAPEGWKARHEKSSPTENQPETSTSDLSQGKNSSWARLIAKVYETDPMICARCGSKMRVAAILEDRDEVMRLLRYLVRIGRAPPGLDLATLN